MALTSVELRGVSKSFPDTGIDAVVDFSLQVAARECLVLFGPSGCGKSTILRLIAGLLRPDSGDICFSGVSMAGIGPERRGAVMMFQDHALFPYRTVGENVAYGLKIAKTPKKERSERVASALRSVRLEGFADRWPDDLSGGQRQRVALARSLVVNPSVLLLDEPLSSLDRELRLEVRDSIASVQRESEITTIMVTHDQDDALAIADRLAVVLDGRLQQVGRVDDVFTDPANDQVARFLGASQ